MGKDMHFLQSITASVALATPVWHHTTPWNITSGAPSPDGTANLTKQVVEILVGAAGQLVFNPEYVNVSKGTVLRFNFLGLNHTLTQATLSNPCERSTQLDTGFQQFNPMNVSGRFLVDFEVYSEDPQWFHCSQSIPRSHCNSGMVFSLNPGDKHGDFVHNAVNSTVMPSSTSVPMICSGGTLPDNILGINRTASSGAGLGYGSRGTSRLLPSATAIVPQISNNAHTIVGSGPIQLVAGIIGAFMAW